LPAIIEKIKAYGTDVASGSQDSQIGSDRGKGIA
jgi:hypothetical protein